MIRTIKRVAAYARFSSDNQRVESIDAQLRAIRTYCKQHGYLIVEEYIDEARSGTSDRRESFQRLIADSKDKSFDIVLVHKLDRFARNRYDSAVYKRELKKNGVTVHSVLENLDDSPESIMLEAVLEGMNEYYSQNLARETMKGLKETAFQCKHTGGTPPLGYDVDPVSKRLILNEYEAESVKIIFDMYSKGYGYSPIIKKLYEEGRKTKTGNDFRKNSLYSILTNPKYQGTYVFNRCSGKDSSGRRNTHLHKDSSEIIAIEGGCPQIIDKETYTKVQKRISEHKHTGGRYVAKEAYLLSGKVFCADCGRAMVGNRHKSYNRDELFLSYRCQNKRQTCANKEINRKYLDAYIVFLLEREIFNSQALKKICSNIKKHIKSKGTAVTINKLSEELKKINTAIQNIADAIATGLISESLVSKLTALEAEKAHIEQVLHESKNVISHSTVDPAVLLSGYKAVKSASPTEYREFIADFIDRIDIGKYSVTIRLKTGLDIAPDFDSTYIVRRQEIYEKAKTPI